MFTFCNYKLIVLLIFSPAYLLGQSFPDYKERDFLIKRDSLQSNRFSNSESFSGYIDPSQYILGPGDKINITIRGINEEKFVIPINYEGFLELPRIGNVDLNKRNLKAAKEILIKEILSVYKNVDIDISLAGIKQIKVSLIGFIENPSVRIISANSRLFDFISTPVTSTNLADIRNIKIISANGNKSTFDLLSFLRLGDQSNNPFLQDGDIIYISRSDKTVSVSGAVASPGIYEYVEGEQALHLLELAGGFLERAKKDTIEISGFADNNKTILSRFYSYSDLQNNSIQIKSGDKIIIREIPEFKVDRYVLIKGFVKYPGIYKIIKDKTSLRDLILKEAGGFLENASLKDSYVIRKHGNDNLDPEFERLKTIPRSEMTDDEYDYIKSKSRLIKGKMVIDFQKLFLSNDLSEDLILERDDEINIPYQQDYITLVGQVNNPGNIIYKPGLKVKDYVELAGGFGWRALENDIRVVKHNTGEWIEEDDIDKLEPGDIVWIPENPPGPRFWDVFQTSLTIAGQVATVIAATVAVIVSTR